MARQLPGTADSDQKGDARSDGLIATLVNTSRTWLELSVRIFLFAGAAISCTFVGLFLCLGIDLLLIIDKQGLLEAIFFYSSIFSVVLAISTLAVAPFTATPARDTVTTVRIAPTPPTVPAPDRPTTGVIATALGFLNPLGHLRRKKAQVEAIVFERKDDATEAIIAWKGKALQALEATRRPLLATLALFLLMMLGLWRALIFGTCVGVVWALARRVPRRAHSLGVLCLVVLGWLRGDYQTQAPANMLLHVKDARPVGVTVVLSSARGVLALQPSSQGGERTVRLVPWEQVASLEALPRAGGSAGWLCDLLTPPVWLPLAERDMPGPCQASGPRR